MNIVMKKISAQGAAQVVWHALRLPGYELRNKGNRGGLPTRGRAGFSLIEVTISIAITAVALVSLMGMLPAGMKTMREAGDRAVETRINQQVLSELQLVEWGDRTKFDYRNPSGGGLRFYDDQGIVIDSDATDFAFTHTYTARISVPMAGQELPQSISGGSYRGVFVPGEVNPDQNLQLVIVEITSVIDDAFKNASGSGSGFDDAKFLKAIRSFQSTIVKMDK